MRYLLLTLLVFALAPATTAHVGLAVTVPDHDAVLERAPTLIHFEFMAEMMLTNLRLDCMSGEQQGERIEVRIPRNDIGQSKAIGQMLDIALPELAPATYQVAWQAISRDGEIMVDDFLFTVSGP
jgi:methionine-rich copper-binding protein CopC